MNKPVDEKLATALSWMIEGGASINICTGIYNEKAVYILRISSNDFDETFVSEHGLRDAIEIAYNEWATRKTWN